MTPGASPVITELEFKSLAAQGYNRIPLLSEAFADLETPLSLYLKLAHASGDGKYSFLLESVVGVNDSAATASSVCRPAVLCVRRASVTRQGPRS